MLKIKISVVKSQKGFFYDKVSSRHKKKENLVDKICRKIGYQAVAVEFVLTILLRVVLIELGRQRRLTMTLFQLASKVFQHITS